MGKGFYCSKKEKMVEQAIPVALLHHYQTRIAFVGARWFKRDG